MPCLKELLASLPSCATYSIRRPILFRTGRGHSPLQREVCLSTATESRLIMILVSFTRDVECNSETPNQKGIKVLPKT